MDTSKTVNSKTDNLRTGEFTLILTRYITTITTTARSTGQVKTSKRTTQWWRRRCTRRSTTLSVTKKTSRSRRRWPCRETGDAIDTTTDVRVEAPWLLGGTSRSGKGRIRNLTRTASASTSRTSTSCPSWSRKWNACRGEVGPEAKL